MKYYLTEKFYTDAIFDGARKARKDVGIVLKDNRFQKITMDRDYSRREGMNPLQLAMEQSRTYSDLKHELTSLDDGDELVIQLPLLSETNKLPALLRSLAGRGVKVYAVIHDTGAVLRRAGYLKALKWCEGIIVYNDKSALEIIEKGIDTNKIVTLELFDYLLPNSVNGACGDFNIKEPVIITGDLSRQASRFIYELPDNCRFRLYGHDYEEENKRNVQCVGDYGHDDLPFVLVGSFGLVWRNPYELSLFLAAGIPVIVRSDSPMADFVIQKGVGFTVKSTAEIGFRIKSMSERRYTQMRSNAIDQGIPLRDGCYTRRALTRLGI